MSHTQGIDPTSNHPFIWRLTFDFVALGQNPTEKHLQVERDIEKRIKGEVYQKGIRVKEFFFDYDKLRKGIVTEDKVITMFSGY